MSKIPVTGYSGKSLAEKLGIKPGMKTLFWHVPKDYAVWLGILPSLLKPSFSPPWDFVHLFLHTITDLENQLAKLRHQIEPAGMIWVSWYKKASGQPTELTEDIIRDTALALGLVDVKVCSVSSEWSGLKLVIRKTLR